MATLLYLIISSQTACGVAVKKVTVDDSNNQASFTEHLGSTLWCSCANCVTMPCAIECTCCRELSELEVEEHLEESSTCITGLEVFLRLYA